MTYQTPRLRPLDLDAASASCCTGFATINFFDKVIIQGTCLPPV